MRFKASPIFSWAVTNKRKLAVLRAIPLSPRDPQLGFWQVIIGDAELGLGRYDAVIELHKRR